MNNYENSDIKTYSEEVYRPPDILSQTEGLEFELEEDVAVIRLQGNCYLTITPFKEGRVLFLKFKLFEDENLLSEADIPINALHVYTRPKYDMFRVELKKCLPK
jgi:hypothetical protein